MSARFDCADPAQLLQGLAEAEAALRRGELVVMPTDTVYGIAAEAFDPVAVDGLLKAKGRGRDMPPPVLVGTVRAAMALVMDLDDAGKDLIEEFWPGALTIVCRSSPTLVWDLGDTKGTVAVRMPLHQLALDLLKRTGPLAVSSANVSGQPPSTSCDEAVAQLGDSVAVYLDSGPCPGDVPSTIVDLTGTVPRLLRQGVIPADRLREVILLNDLEETGPGDAAGDGTVTADAGDPDGAAHGDAGEPDGVAADRVSRTGWPRDGVAGDGVSRRRGSHAGRATPGEATPGGATPGGATPGQEDAPDQGEPSRGPAAG